MVVNIPPLVISYIHTNKLPHYGIVVVKWPVIYWENNNSVIVLGNFGTGTMNTIIAANGQNLPQLQ